MFSKCLFDSIEEEEEEEKTRRISIVEEVSHSNLSIQAARLSGCGSTGKTKRADFDSSRLPQSVLAI